MAKLTAFFDMQDRISAKINSVSTITEKFANTIKTAGVQGSTAFSNIMDEATLMSFRVGYALDELAQKTERYADASKTIANTLGPALAVGGAAVVAGAAVAVFAADGLNKSLNHIQASTGATEAEMAGLESTMLSIYNNNFGEGFDDIGKSLSTVKQITGASGDELERLTTNALMMRDTFEMEVTESVRAANTMMKQFGITGDQAYTLVAQAAQNGANKNGDLLDTINEYSVQFKSLGFNADQFANILIDGAANGAWSIDKVGDAMKEFNIRAKDGSKSSAEGFEALGFDAADMTTRFAQGGDVAQAAFQQVMQAMESIEDPVARNAAGVALFGTQFEDLEAQGILAFGHISNKANMSADTLDKINSVKYKSFGEAMTGIGRNLQTGLLIPLGKKLLPTLNNFSTWTTTNMPAIQNGIGAAFDFIGNTINFVSNNFDIIGPVVAAVIFTMVLPALIAWATTAWATAAANIAAMAPLIAVALAVGAVVAVLALAWRNNFLGIQSITSLVFTLIISIFTTGVNFITGIVKGFFQILTGDFTDGATTIIQTVMNLIGGLQSAFWNLVTGAAQIGIDFADNIVQGFGSIIGGIVEAAQSVWNKVRGIFGGKQGFNAADTANLADLANDGASAGAMINGSHASGLDRVPFDGYIAELHKGESVLNAREAEQYRNLSAQETQRVMATSPTATSTTDDSTVNINSLFGDVTINNEADIAKIIKMIEEYLRELLNSSGEGVYDV